MVKSLDSGVEQSNRGEGFEDDKDSMILFTWASWPSWLKVEQSQTWRPPSSVTAASLLIWWGFHLWRFDGKKILTWRYFDEKKIPKPWCLFYPTRHHRPRCQRWSPRTRPSFSGPTPSITKTTTRIADNALNIPSHRRCHNQQQSEANIVKEYLLQCHI